MKKLLILIFAFVFFNANAQSSWEFEDETYIKGSISGTITKGYIFKVNSRDYYVVNERNRPKSSDKKS